MPALAKRIEIGAEDRAELERIVRSSTEEVRMVERAQIVLGAAVQLPSRRSSTCICTLSRGGDGMDLGRSGLRAESTRTPI